SNQRAFLHAAAGEYELALADYAIVLQLDPHNVTALVGRELTLQARAAQPAGREPSSATQSMVRHSTTKAHAVASTEEAAVEPAATTEGADQFEDFELIPGDDEAATHTDDGPSASKDEAATVSVSTAAEQGPFQARVAQEQHERELSERARLWAEMR